MKVAVNTSLFVVNDTRNGRYYLSGGKKWWYEASNPLGPWRTVGGPPADIAEFAAKAAGRAEEGREGRGGRRRHRERGSAARRRRDRADRARRHRGQAGPQAGRRHGRQPPRGRQHGGRRPLRRLRRRTTTCSSPGAGSRASPSPGTRGPTSRPTRVPASFTKIPPESDSGDVRASRRGDGRGRGGRPRRADPADDGRQARRGDARRPVGRRAELHPDRELDDGVRAERVDLCPPDPRPLLRVRERGVVRRPTRRRGRGRVADSVPEGDIDAIPPSAPVYNVKYVRIYDATPDVVYVRLHARLHGRLSVARHGRVGHGLALPPVGRPDVLVAAPLHVGPPRALQPVDGLGLRILVELPVHQRELRLGRLVPAARLVPAGLRRLGRRLASSRRMGLVRAGRLSPARGHRGQLLGRPRAAARGTARSRTRVPAPCVPRSGPCRGVRPGIGFRPPPRDIRPPAPTNIYNRLPANVARRAARSVVLRQAARRDGQAEQRLRRQERRGLPPDEGRAVAAARGRPRGRPSGGTARPSRARQRSASRSTAGATPSPGVSRPAPRPELDRDFSARQRGDDRVRERSRPAARREPRVPPGARSRRRVRRPQAKSAPSAPPESRGGGDKRQAAR